MSTAPRALLRGAMTVGDLLEGESATAAPHEGAGRAWERMNELNVDYLVVVQDGQAIGVLARDDLRGPAGGSRRRMGRTVGNLMRRDFASVTPGTSVQRAAMLMRRQRFGCLPVLRRGHLVGLLTVDRLLQVLERAVA
jgi:CBS domain-containing protein